MDPTNTTPSRIPLNLGQRIVISPLATSSSRPTLGHIRGERCYQMSETRNQVALSAELGELQCSLGYVITCAHGQVRRIRTEVISLRIPCTAVLTTQCVVQACGRVVFSWPCNLCSSLALSPYACVHNGNDLHFSTWGKAFVNVTRAS